jgi:hypothetical protein
MKIKSTMMAGALLLAGWGYAVDYYVSPGGDDKNDGSAAAPWKSIEKANAALKPGDTAIFLAGEYAGCIEPANSGEPGKPVTFRAEQPGTVRLTGGHSKLFNEKLLIALKGRRHIVVDGFTARDIGECRWFWLTDVQYSVIRNCTFDGTTRQNPIVCRDSGFNRFENIYAGRCNYLRPTAMVAGDMWNNFNCSNNVFTGLYLTKAGHRPFGLWFDCENNVIRDTVFDCRWGRNFELFSAKRVLMERCVITNCFDGSGSADSRAKLFVIDSIFRRNLVFRNPGAPMVINAYKYEDLPTFGMIGSRMYFNTFYRNVDFGFQMIDIDRDPKPHMVHGNVLKNNIFSENNPGGEGTALSLGGNIAPDNLFIGNLLHGTSPGQPVVRITWTENLRLTAAEANRTRSAQFKGNFDADPLFVDAAADDYRLLPDSPALDRALPLTLATADGKGRELPVADAAGFFDGFGIPGEEGDMIMVGPDKTPARVLKADRAKNVLSLDRDIAFRKGDTVDLPYGGKAPDLGAYESGMETGPKIPDNLRHLAVETGKVPLIVKCSFEVGDQEDWFYVFSHTRQKNSTAAVDDAKAATGKRSVKVSATGDGSVLSLLTRPGLWDIDLFPTVEFAYCIPPGVPVGIALYPFDAAEFKYYEVFIGGSPGYATGNSKDLKKYQLVADGEWHTIALDARVIRELMPTVKMLRTFRFTTAGNGKNGDAFWIDDFTIRP